MQVTEKIHTVKVPFKIPVAPDTVIDRTVYVTLIFGREITLIDTGVKSAHNQLFAYIKQQPSLCRQSRGCKGIHVKPARSRPERPVQLLK